MDIKNLDMAVRYKGRLDELDKLKELIEKSPSGYVTYTTMDNQQHAVVQEDNLTGLIYKYCVDTIKQIEKEIEKL